MTVPTFVVAGAARSGTTALTEGVRAHPDAFVTHPKEPHYLALAGQPAAFTGPGDQDTINRVAITDEHRYLDLFPPEGGYTAVGEGSVSTLYYHQASLPVMQKLNPDLRVVLMLRDPVQRAFSSYLYLRARGLEPLGDFRAALADEQRRVRVGWHHLWHYTGMSHYADAVDHFVSVLGRERLGVWFYDDFLADGPSVMDEIYRFLRLDPDRCDTSGLARVNVSGQPRSRKVQALIQAASRHDAVRRAVKSIVPFHLRERIRRGNLAPSSLPPELDQELRDLFREDIQRLGKILDTPMPDWARGAA